MEHILFLSSWRNGNHKTFWIAFSPQWDKDTECVLYKLCQIRLTGKALFPSLHYECFEAGLCFRLLPQCWDVNPQQDKTGERVTSSQCWPKHKKSVCSVWGFFWHGWLQNTLMETSVRNVGSCICGSSKMVGFIMGTVLHFPPACF